MNSTIKNMHMALLATLVVVTVAVLTCCDDRAGTATSRSPARTKSAPASHNDTAAKAFEEPQGREEAAPTQFDAPLEPAESKSADRAASTLADTRTSLGETMQALAELLEASQRMQRELLDAPDRFSSPDRADDGGKDKSEKEG